MKEIKRRQEAAEAAEREKREREAAEAAAQAAADVVDRAADTQTPGMLYSQHHIYIHNI